MYNRRMDHVFMDTLQQHQSILEYAHVHMVGIKGVAMTALALCLQDAGVKVTGSDVPEEFVTHNVLRHRHFHIFHGFSPNNIGHDTQLVIYTGAHQGQHNTEVVHAKEKGIRVMSHAEALGNIMAGKKVVSVCGAGGKSTTSAMVAWILEKAGKAPSFAVGVGNIPGIDVPGKYVRDSEWFVAEADEYAVDPTSDRRPRFIFQHPQVVACTNVTYDHPDIYPDFEVMKTTFETFLRKATSGVYVNADSADLLEMFTSLRAREEIPFESCSIGRIKRADYQIDSSQTEGGKTNFTFTYRGDAERQPHVEGQQTWQGTLQVPGEHNVRNAMLAFLIAVNECGVEEHVALRALSEFQGTMRRFEFKGTVNGADWFDDYAHTPDEIKTTLQALRTWRPGKKIIAVFQPHTYSRTQALFDGFSRCFTDADEVILLDIFASARENENRNISSDMLVSAIIELDSSRNVKNMKDIESARAYIETRIDKDCVVITLGAGDVYTLFDAVAKK